ncbi:MAG TPA: hypothetical protein VD999_00240 [Vitreimonas sp.]|nr:hypothetical protein [Vitreimonas sp.]
MLNSCHILTTEHNSALQLCADARAKLETFGKDPTEANKQAVNEAIEKLPPLHDELIATLRPKVIDLFTKLLTKNPDATFANLNQDDQRNVSQFTVSADGFVIYHRNALPLCKNYFPTVIKEVQGMVRHIDTTTTYPNLEKVVSFVIDTEGDFNTQIVLPKATHIDAISQFTGGMIKSNVSFPLLRSGDRIELKVASFEAPLYDSEGDITLETKSDIVFPNLKKPRKCTLSTPGNKIDLPALTEIRDGGTFTCQEFIANNLTDSGTTGLTISGAQRVEIESMVNITKLECYRATDIKASKLKTVESVLSIRGITTVEAFTKAFPQLIAVGRRIIVGSEEVRDYIEKIKSENKISGQFTVSTIPLQPITD